MKFESAQQLTDYLKEENFDFIDVRFSDLSGVMQHFTIPASSFSSDMLTEGLLFDGSSVKGFQSIDESDMLLIPDITNVNIDQFRYDKTLDIVCFVQDPVTGEAYSRDPRNVALKAEKYLTESGIADNCFFGPEAEFYIFDAVAYESGINHAYYEVDSESGWWNRGSITEANGEPNLGYKVRPKGGYFPLSPYDHYADLRNDIASNLMESGFKIERSHHEVGTGGQTEINYEFNTLLAAADDLQLFKYIVKNTVWEAGKTATFMPKPLYGDNGSGMHCHQSLWKDGKPLFYDKAGYAGLSDMAIHYIGGILKHAPSLLAFTNPTINSYRRLVPGYEAPTNLVYSQRNRSACIRIPVTGDNPKAKRIEFRCPDSSANPYLAFAAMLLAGLDGIKNAIEPHQPLDRNLYDLTPEEVKQVPQTPNNLETVINNLEEDHSYLTENGVFSEDLISTWIKIKREEEILPLRLKINPEEFSLYYDC